MQVEPRTGDEVGLEPLARAKGGNIVPAPGKFVGGREQRVHMACGAPAREQNASHGACP